MFSRFFIDRPIFATVLSIVITLAGGLAVFNLPLAQYPPVTPPTVQVNCNYPGASAEVVAETVAAPIEQQVNGVENMLYMSSQCTNDGSYNLTVTFKQGVNLNLAQVLVQNRVNLALPMLPDVLKQTGVTTRKMSPDILMSVNINSPDGRYDQLYLSNYALLHIRDELLRAAGRQRHLHHRPARLQHADLGRSRQARRARTSPPATWSRPSASRTRRWPPGRSASSRSAPGQETQITLSTLGRLNEPGAVRRTSSSAPTPDGRIMRLKDVARVELGAKNEDVSCKLDGKPSVGLIIFQLPDANALDVADRIHAKMDELAKDFPDDLIYEIQYDTTPYTRECIDEVVQGAARRGPAGGLRGAACSCRTGARRSFPLVAVPVAIIGTFARDGGHRLQPQQPDAVRPGAGDRHRGRRRDRGGRGGGAPHRAGPGAARGHDQGDGARSPAR